jgi:hypothetical protein
MGVAAKVYDVPTALGTKASGSTAENRCWAFQPVQCGGTRASGAVFRSRPVVAHTEAFERQRQQPPDVAPQASYTGQHNALLMR